MKFKSVSSYKDDIIVKCPIYFSTGLCRFLLLRQKENPAIFHQSILSILMNIYAKNNNHWIGIISTYIIEKLITTEHQFIVFSAKLNKRICLLGILESELKKLPPYNKQSNISTEEIVIDFCLRRQDIILVNPPIKRAKILLKKIFDREQAETYLRYAKNAFKYSMN